MVNVLQILTAFFALLAFVFALLLGTSITGYDFGGIKFLQWFSERQLLLLILTIESLAVSLVSNYYKKRLTSQQRVGTARTPFGEMRLEAALKRIQKELKEADGELAKKAEGFFNTAKQDEKERRFKDAAGNYGKSVDVIPTMSAYLNLGHSLLDLSEFDSAKEAYESGLKIALNKKEKGFEAIFKGSLGLVCFDKGNLDEALKSYKEALEIFEDIKNPLGQAIARTSTGTVYFRQGRLDESLKSYKAALDINRKIDRPLGRAIALGNIGIVYVKQGKKVEALGKLKEARDIYKQIGAGTPGVKTVEGLIKELEAEE